MHLNRIAAVLAAFFVVTPSIAADIGSSRLMPRQHIQTYDWSGFYAGINAGGGWGTVHERPDPTLPGFGTVVPALEPSGAFAGGQVGYNWQLGRWVVGVEADYHWSGLSSTRTINECPGCGPDTIVTTSNKLDLTSFGTARLRAGRLLAERLLVYGTFGLGYGFFKATDTFTFIDPTFSFVDSVVTRSPGVGWVGGLGVEWAVFDSMSLKFEGLYAELYRTDTVSSFSASSNNFGMVLVRGGFNIRL